uniref:Serine (or cysteine) peptidase inhibitor, clade H, member 2 n=1 Tax=Nothobranchius furzeri TaxID=105023 RepID=A0A8C6KDT5_NOTFU
ASVNTLISSLLLASLAALGEGSLGQTTTQIQGLLKPVTPPSKVGDLLSEALKSFTEANGTSFQVHTSSGVFTKQGPAISQAFTKQSQTRFRLQNQALGKGDFKADPKQLQAWATATHRGLEGAPLLADIKAKAGAMILANALHFKGLWERKVNEEKTDPRTFLGKKYTKVIMMHRAGTTYLYIYRQISALKRASLVLLLPFHVENLARLDKLLTLELLSKRLEKTSVASVAISMPKANITSTLSLQKQLSALGVADAWDQESTGKLHLGGVLHWASLELGAGAGKQDEESEEEKMDRPKMFYADHPFIILVRDNASRALLMMGALDHAEGEVLHDEL